MIVMMTGMISRDSPLSYSPGSAPGLDVPLCSPLSVIVDMSLTIDHDLNVLVPPDDMDDDLPNDDMTIIRVLMIEVAALILLLVGVAAVPLEKTLVDTNRLADRLEINTRIVVMRILVLLRLRRFLMRVTVALHPLLPTTRMNKGEVIAVIAVPPLVRTRPMWPLLWFILLVWRATLLPWQSIVRKEDMNRETTHAIKSPLWLASHVTYFSCCWRNG